MANCRPGADGGLEERDETGDEEDGAEYFADILGLVDAHGRSDDQPDAQVGAETRQTVLLTACTKH